MSKITSATFTRHGGVMFFEFSFHAEMIGNGRGAFLKTGLFHDRATFEAQLHSWNRDGWRYFTTAEDIEANAEPAAVLAYPCPVHRTETVTARTGKYAHNFAFVIRATDAERIGRDLGIPAHEVGEHDCLAAFHSAA